jgi:hypothetical protein
MEPSPAELVLKLPISEPAGRSSPWKRWLFRGEHLDEKRGHPKTHPWYLVLWLTGVDYFSTLGYQPGIALLAAGSLSPLATAILVAVTLFGALPIYRQVASRSYAGQGSIAMLENLLKGWTAKIFVLVLLGFAATDFVITMTLSAADASQHAIENPLFHTYLGEARVSLTLVFLALLAVVFLKGFREAIGLAGLVAIPYLFLNLVVLSRGLWEILGHPELLGRWRLDLAGHGDWQSLFLVSLIVFPKLALGMSGFETGVSVMPLVEGSAGDRFRDRPLDRILATRKLLAFAALIMSVLLLLSSFVTALLVPPEAYRLGGPASGRAIAFLAHEMLGHTFGTVYDISTILILWFAGASAMAGLLNLIPRYLPRYGMAPRWVSHSRPLVLVLFAIDAVVTVIFKANVEAQGGAYATGVLMLMLSAAVAVALAFQGEAYAEPERRGALMRSSFYFWIIAAVFLFTLVDNVIERPDGIVIASVFIVTILIFSALSRLWRATELRVTEAQFVDERSAELWQSIRGKKVHLVPLKGATPQARALKAAELRRHYAAKGPLAFVHVNLMDNRSEFLTPLQVKVSAHDENYFVIVTGAIATANSIAFISEAIDPISIFLGLTRENLMVQSLRYLLWGEGETGLMVYTILLRYWESTPEEDIRPFIFLMSE